MLSIHELEKKFANGYVALKNINLEVKQSEIVSLVGTSGCGKSTLLRLIAGLDLPTSGEIFIDQEIITQPHPKIGIIFQESRLMPWLSVKKNVEFGLEGLSAEKKDHLTKLILARVGLSEFSHALPRQLSGGMAQRVAIARALVTSPSILLLDEPFSALDAFIRSSLQEHLLNIWEYDQPTMILVTHDIEEAVYLSDRVIVLRGTPGNIHQEFSINLPRPRRRCDPHFTRWKERIFQALDLSFEQV